MSRFAPKSGVIVLDHEDQAILLIFGVVLFLLLLGVMADTVVYMRQERSETDKRE